MPGTMRKAVGGTFTYSRTATFSNCFIKECKPGLVLTLKCILLQMNEYLTSRLRYKSKIEKNLQVLNDTKRVIRNVVECNRLLDY